MKNVMVFMLLCCPLLACAATPYEITKDEIAALPAVCVAKLRGPSEPYEAQVGPENWTHMQRYCHGVNFIKRANQAGAGPERDQHLLQAKAEYAYVLDRFRPDFWMRPLIYLEAGTIHFRLNEPEDAIGRFRDAIDANPNYGPAHLALVLAYKHHGDDKKALDTATAGLRYLPDSVPLQEAYLELGGSKPFPEPIAQTARSEGAGKTDPVESTTEADLNAAPERGCRFCPPDDIRQRWRKSFGTDN